MEKSSVELAKNRLILGQFYSTLLSLHLPLSKWTINWEKKKQNRNKSPNKFSR